MSGKSKLTTRDMRLEEVCGELLRAVKVGEDEIAATAGSADLFEGVRLKIADIGEGTGRRMSIHERWSGFHALLAAGPRFRVLTAAAAILLLLAASVFVLLPGPPSTEQLAQRAKDTPAPTSAPQVEIQAEPPAEMGTIHPSSNQSGGRSRRRQHVESRSTEVATDFLPLTFVDDSRAQESGHVVRLKVPRSALIAFGLPMNMERAGELITADVVIGNDGLARAIRFVQ